MGLWGPQWPMDIVKKGDSLGSVWGAVQAVCVCLCVPMQGLPLVVE